MENAWHFFPKRQTSWIKIVLFNERDTYSFKVRRRTGTSFWPIQATGNSSKTCFQLEIYKLHSPCSRHLIWTNKLAKQLVDVRVHAGLLVPLLALLSLLPLGLCCLDCPFSSMASQKPQLSFSVESTSNLSSPLCHIGHTVLLCLSSVKFFQEKSWGFSGQIHVENWNKSFW